MEAKELMIGDWVLYQKESIKVKNIHNDMINFYPDIPYVQEEDYIDIKEINPIPLTTDILNKNGFIYDDTPFVQAWVQYGLTIFENRINCGQNVSMKVQYVHELQHALRLCGIEKEIEL